MDNIKIYQKRDLGATCLEPVRHTASWRHWRSAIGWTLFLFVSGISLEWSKSLWNAFRMAEDSENSAESQRVVLCVQGLDGQLCLSPWTRSPPPPVLPWMLDQVYGIQQPRRTPRQRRKDGQSLQTSSLSVGKRGINSLHFFLTSE